MMSFLLVALTMRTKESGSCGTWILGDERAKDGRWAGGSASLCAGIGGESLGMSKGCCGAVCEPWFVRGVDAWQDG
jgi:hypothetical protein